MCSNVLHICYIQYMLHCEDSHYGSTFKRSANLTQILNFKPNFHKDFYPFLFLFECGDNGKHFKMVSNFSPYAGEGVFSRFGGFFATFFSMWGPSSYGFYHVGAFFAVFFLHVGEFLGFPSPLRKLLRAPMDLF